MFAMFVMLAVIATVVSALFFIYFKCKNKKFYGKKNGNMWILYIIGADYLGVWNQEYSNE